MSQVTIPVTEDTWVVDIKGGPNDTFEISVLRNSNTHGKASYGWIGDDKLLISGSGGPCRDTVLPLVWNRLIRVAHETARDLNAIEVEAKIVDLKALT